MVPVSYFIFFFIWYNVYALSCYHYQTNANDVALFSHCVVGPVEHGGISLCVGDGHVQRATYDVRDQ